MTSSTCPTPRRALATWLLRGGLGLAFVALAMRVGEPLVALPALIAALVLFRGCPMCWIAGLIQCASDAFGPAGRRGEP